MSGSFLYAPHVPLQVSTLFAARDRCGEFWGNESRELLVVDSTEIYGTGSFWNHTAVDLLTDETVMYSEYKLTSRFKRRA
jgi:hypothetical protein